MLYMFPGRTDMTTRKKVFSFLDLPTLRSLVLVLERVLARLLLSSSCRQSELVTAGQLAQCRGLIFQTAVTCNSPNISR